MNEFRCLLDVIYAKNELQQIHSGISLSGGHLGEEYSEQLMSMMYISPLSKVLECGGNIGRNSCVIASILVDSANLVVVEPCKNYARILKENRIKNHFKFHVEESAISLVPLLIIKKDGLDKYVVQSDVDLPGYDRIDTITFSELVVKYGIDFDVLVADCEGALYYMLSEDESILNNIKTIIVENDYKVLDHLEFVLNVFKEKGFHLVYNQVAAFPGCEQFVGEKWFYQVWQKD